VLSRALAGLKGLRYMLNTRELVIQAPESLRLVRY
jgi:hypothetical protein